MTKYSNFALFRFFSFARFFRINPLTLYYLLQYLSVVFASFKRMSFCWRLALLRFIEYTCNREIVPVEKQKPISIWPIGVITFSDFFFVDHLR